MQEDGVNEGCGGGDGARDSQAVRDRMSHIAHKVLVLSGKGGVGKSTVAVNLAVSLMLEGKRVGLLDVDIHGPSVPKMLGLEGSVPQTEGNTILPVELGDMRVMSIGFLLKDGNEAVIWRGPMKMGVIQQFLADVQWGELDYLVVDAPPGTGDEPLSVCQLIEGADGAVIVTTPQEVALSAVRRSVSFCRKLSVPVLGVVENMSGYVCPQCGKEAALFGSGGGERMAGEMGVPFLARIPFDPAVAEACDAGKPYVHAYAGSAAAKAFHAVVEPILKLSAEAAKTGASMKVAIPVAEGKLAAHFGHCPAFALIDVDMGSRTITARTEIAAPEHQPGLLPPWLAERGVKTVIAGGMGQSAQKLFHENGIRLVLGASSETPEKLVKEWLAGTLKTGDNACDH